MAHEHVFLVQDKAFELACLKDRSKAQQGGQVEVGDRLLAKIVDFVHPRTGDPTKFMMVGGNLLELQVARPRRQEKASFFIDQSVQESGAVHMASRVDPLFIVLPALLKYARKWCPLDQALAEAGCGGLRGLNHLDARKLCDVNDRLGPDELLIRVNEDLVLKWLIAKVERASKRFRELAMGSDGHGGEGVGTKAIPGDGDGFAAEFRGSETSNDPGARGRIEEESNQQALEAVCEYLPDEWAVKLAENSGTERALLFGDTSGAPKKRKAVWEESAEVDRSLELSHGTAKARAESSATAAAATASKIKQSLSQGQRSLAKVNKKGMKSIASFFSK